MTTEKFLILCVIVLTLLIGALIHTIWLQGKDIKASKRVINKTLSFVDRVLKNIAVCENIDIQKYIDITNKQLNNLNEGGENNG